tara:strand:- start:172 stop:3297 length:3126 start_codon:yes stop_codon:yes gene_type:complete
MLFQYHSTSLKDLENKFQSIRSATQGELPLAQRWIIVQNREMEQWLTLREASQSGISANNKFIFPLELIWKLYRLKDNSIPSVLPFDLVPMQWSIFSLLLEQPNLVQGYGFNSEDLNPERLFQVSTNLADVFDLYQVFRPDLILSWQKGFQKFNSKEEEWQAKIWVALCAKIGETDLPSRAQALTKLITWLESDQFPLENLPKSLYVFGVSQISQPFSDLLASLSKKIDVHFFTQSIQDEDTGNRNSAWTDFKTKLTKPALDQEIVLARSEQSFSSRSEVQVILSELNATNNLLSNIQKAMLGNEVTSFEKDASFSIHSCHSVKREVEVLKDELLTVLNEDVSLMPQDILVLVPDVEEYSATIEQVFSLNHKDPKLPISTTKVMSKSVGIVFEQLMNQMNGDFKATEILSIIEHPIISYKTEISDVGLSMLRKWVGELRIRKGKGENIYSWMHGLNSLMLGYAMEAEELESFGPYIPFEGIASSDLAETAAKVSSFVSLLKNLSDEAQKDRSVHDWLDFATASVQQLMIPIYNDEFGCSRLISNLERIKEQVRTSEFSGEIEFAMFKEWVLSQLANISASSGGFGHGITISTYVPNRGLPYKYIAVLGFNEGVFPRKEIRPSYDLIHNTPLPGDRILKEDDSYLFFQILQSAQERLYFSYLGQSQYSENKQLPSILLQQLMDVLKKSGLEGKDLVQYHKLHGFDKSYFGAETRTFSKSNASLSNKIYTQHNVVSPFIEKLSNTPIDILNNSLELSELISYYQSPAKFIGSRNLGISSYRDEIQISDREPFSLSGLEKYLVKEAIANSFSKEIAANELVTFLQQKGILPQKLPGEIIFEELFESLKPLEQVFEKYAQQEKRTLEGKAKVSNINLQGAVSDVYDNEFVQIRLGSLKGKNLVNLWINHLFLNITYPEITRSVLYFVNKKDVEQVFFSPVENAEELLQSLIGQFKLGCLEPTEFPFLPEAMKEYFEALDARNGTPEKALVKAQSSWIPSQYNNFAEGADYYNQLLWRGIEPVNQPRFQEIAKEIWSPLMQSKREA